MKKRVGFCGILLAGFFYSATIHAGNVIISGEFFGTEALAPGPPSLCGSFARYQHHQVGPIRVSITGTYFVIDSSSTTLFFNQVGRDVTSTVYSGSYDINNSDEIINLVPDT